MTILPISKHDLLWLVKIYVRIDFLGPGPVFSDSLEKLIRLSLKVSISWIFESLSFGRRRRCTTRRQRQHRRHATTLCSTSDRLKWPDRNKPPTLTPQRDLLFHSKKCPLRKKNCCMIKHKVWQVVGQLLWAWEQDSGRIAQWLKDLLPDPAAPGSIPSVPQTFSEEHIVNIVEVNLWCCYNRKVESGLKMLIESNYNTLKASQYYKKGLGQ